MSEATVILCVRDGAATIGDQLSALASQNYPDAWELIIVDNGSTDETLQVVEAWQPRLSAVRVIGATQRAGLAYARNVGAQAAEGEILAFCDADDVADNGWLAALVAAARHGDLVAGRLEHVSLNSPEARLWRGVANGVSDRRVGLGYLPYAPGANFAVRRRMFEAVGGCDEAFIICGDDFDLSWRIQQAGGTLVVAGDAVMHYRLRNDLRGVMRQRYHYGYAEAMLRRKFHDVVPPMAGKARLRANYRLLGRSWQLAAGRRRRGAWLAQAANLAGQLHGSLKYRVLA